MCFDRPSFFSCWGPARTVLLKGVIDSGADYTCLPHGYAALLGYTENDLDEATGGQVQGEVTFWRPRAPLIAMLPGDPERSFELHPNFVEGSDMTLWGRIDFFAAWHVIVSEGSKQFTLIKV